MSDDQITSQNLCFLIDAMWFGVLVAYSSLFQYTVVDSSHFVRITSVDTLGLELHTYSNLDVTIFQIVFSIHSGVSHRVGQI